MTKSKTIGFRLKEDAMNKLNSLMSLTGKTVTEALEYCVEFTCMDIDSLTSEKKMKLEFSSLELEYIGKRNEIAKRYKSLGIEKKEIADSYTSTKKETQDNMITT